MNLFSLQPRYWSEKQRYYILERVSSAISGHIKVEQYVSRPPIAIELVLALFVFSFSDLAAAPPTEVGVRWYVMHHQIRLNSPWLLFSLQTLYVPLFFFNRPVATGTLYA